MPNQPKTPGHTVRIPDDEWIPAKDKAAKEGETMTDVIRRALRRYVVGTVIAVTVLALADCGGAPTVKGVDYTSAESIVTALNTGGFECTGWTPNDGVIGAREDGWCTHGDGTVSVSTFDSAVQMQAMNDAVEAFTSGIPVQGEKWQVSSRDEVQAVAVRKILGGDVQYDANGNVILFER
jgi:hypothetical protein